MDNNTTQGEYKMLSWAQCSMTLKKKQNSQPIVTTFQSLAPIIHLYDTQVQENTSPSFKINMVKGMIYCEDVGFCWHKSRLIPQIEIKIDQQQFEVLNQNKQFGSFFCQMLCAIVVKGNITYLEQVPLDKQAKIQFNSNSIKFTNSKFSKTSFQYNRSNFHLLVCIYYQRDNIKNYIVSFLSTPFYIDSRKQARVSKSLCYKTVQFQHFLQPAKIYNGKKHIKLQNSCHGFIEYYSAQSVRNKIKNPFYISYHFSSAFKLFYSHKLLKSPIEGFKALLQQVNGDNILFLMVALTQDYDLIKSIKHVFNKLLKLGGVSLEFDSIQSVGSAWLPITRREIAQIIRQYIEDDGSYPKPTNQQKITPKQWQFTTQIVIQRGESINNNLSNAKQIIKQQC